MKFRPGVQHVRVCSGLVVTLTSAAACAPAPDRALHTIEEYRHEIALRETTFARCANDVELRDSADCINAREAERLEGVGSLRELPPLSIPRARPAPAPQRPKNEG